MNLVDIIIILLLAYGLVSGFMSGFIKQAILFSGLVLAVLGAKFLSPALTELLKSHITIPDFLYIPIAYIILFLLILLACKLIATLLKFTAKMIMLGSLDKELGALLGILKWVLIVSVCINLYDMIDPKGKLLSLEHRTESKAYYTVKKISPAFFPVVKREYDNLVSPKK